MKKLKRQFVNLLNIHGISGDEGKVRNYLLPTLSSLLDTVYVDEYGNLLGEKVYGNGNGATVLLSAHMDTVRGVLSDRTLIDKNGKITSSKGVLGADDRAGIAIILAVLRNMKNLDFNGVIKVAFSREEEIGCIGASMIDSNWYAKTDLAIVVDRRGNRDIVVGCGSAFCSDSVGNFMEEVSGLTDMDWKCVEGGISDAMVFSENGVNSINLSAGYMNEHTAMEYAVISDMRDTVRLILQTFGVINSFYEGFKDIGYENKWVKSWNRNYKYGTVNNRQYYEDVFNGEIFEDSDIIDTDVWAEEDDINGSIYVYELDGVVIINQDDQEIIMTKKSLQSLVGQMSHLLPKK